MASNHPNIESEFNEPLLLALHQQCKNSRNKD